MTPAAPGAFDPLADGYDDVALSALGVHYRHRVARIVDSHTPPSARILDVGCGTGIDAARLAGAGHRVVAMDASAEMVAMAAKRLDGVANAEVHHQDLDTLDQSDIAGPFDVVLANFGVVNCCRDLPRFGRWLESALSESGTAVLVTMAPICPPELAKALVTGNRSLLFRRRRPVTGSGAVEGSPSVYAGLTVRYFSAKGLVSELGPGFVLTDARALGVVLPTFEQRRFVEHRPRLLRVLGIADRMAGSPAVGLATGDHHVAVIKRGPAR